MSTLSVSVCRNFRSPFVGKRRETQQFRKVKDGTRRKYSSDGVLTSYLVVLEVISHKSKPSLDTFTLSVLCCRRSPFEAEN